MKFSVLLNEILSSLGEHLCSADNYRQMSSEALIQSWWKIASNIKSTFHFLQALEPWLQYACTHLSVSCFFYINSFYIMSMAFKNSSRFQNHLNRQKSPLCLVVKTHLSALCLVNRDKYSDRLSFFLFRLGNVQKFVELRTLKLFFLFNINSLKLKTFLRSTY